MIAFRMFIAKNKRAHILHLFTHCIPSYNYFCSLQIANYCLMPLIPSRTCPARLLTTITSVYTQCSPHLLFIFSSLQRTTATNTKTTSANTTVYSSFVLPVLMLQSVRTRRFLPIVSSRHLFFLRSAVLPILSCLYSISSSTKLS